MKTIKEITNRVHELFVDSMPLVVRAVKPSPERIQEGDVLGYRSTHEQLFLSEAVQVRVPIVWRDHDTNLPNDEFERLYLLPVAKALTEQVVAKAKSVVKFAYLPNIQNSCVYAHGSNYIIRGTMTYSASDHGMQLYFDAVFCTYEIPGMRPPNLIENDISIEEWREYGFNNRVYQVDKPTAGWHDASDS